MDSANARLGGCRVPGPLGAALAVVLGVVGCAPSQGASGGPASTTGKADDGAGRTVGAVVHHTCCTNAVSGLSRQLLGELRCILAERGELDSAEQRLFDSLMLQGVSVGENCPTFPYAQRSVVDAVRNALSETRRSLEVTSAVRTVAQQFLLRQWYELGEGSGREPRCGVVAAAEPGESTHESGLAIDIPREDLDTFAPRLRRAGFSNISGDPVHFEYEQGGQTLQSLSVLAFQRLWNANRDGQIAEDGEFGPQTVTRLRNAPADGFQGGPSCGAGGPSLGGGPPGGAQAVDPCAEASCTEKSEVIAQCVPEQRRADFEGSGTNVHAYPVRLESMRRTEIRIERTDEGPLWQPSLYVTGKDGKVIFDGESRYQHEQVDVHVLESPNAGGSTRIDLVAERATSVQLHVTAREVVDGRFVGGSAPPDSASYQLSFAESCERWSDVYDGLEQEGMFVPRQGLYNGTLESVLGGDGEEPHGEVVDHEARSFVEGPVGWFGGPNGPAGETAITREELRELNTPLDASKRTLRDRPEDFYFVAMRFNYRPEGSAWWADARLLVVNPETGDAVVARPVDWGPGTAQGRIMNVSPQMLEVLNAENDDELLVSFAKPWARLGPIR